MDTSLSFQFSAWLLTVGVGGIVLMALLWRATGGPPAFLRRLSGFLYRKKIENPSDWRENLSSTSDVSSSIRRLSHSDQLEMVEHLIKEKPPFAAILLDAVLHVAKVSSGDVRRKALSFLDSSSVPLAARVSLAQRILESTIDDEARVVALKALLAIVESTSEIHRTGLLDSIAYIVARRLTDSSPQVQNLAIDALEGILRDSLPAMDEALAKRLSVTRGDALLSLIRFIDRNSSLVPQASNRARMYDTNTR